MSKLLPGDQVKFTYRDKKGTVSDRNLTVEHVEKKDGKTFVGGYDLSVGPNAYRQFNQANMTNLRVNEPATVQETKGSEPTFVYVFPYREQDSNIFRLLLDLLGVF